MKFESTVHIETITSPPGCKLFYCAGMSQFLEVVGNNGLPQHTQFPYAQASLHSATFAVMSHSVILFFTKLLSVHNVVFDLRSRRSSLPVRAFASTPMLSARLGTGSGACDLRGTPATSLINPAILCR